MWRVSILVGLCAAGCSGSPSLAAGDGGGGPAVEGGGADGAPDPGTARADVPAIACADAPGDVYVTPAGLPAMTAAERGTIVRCAPDGILSMAEVAEQLPAGGVAGPAQSGTRILRVAFRTLRGDGTPGVSSARVYLPDAPRALPLPVIVVAHPTVGQADGCAPSADPGSLRNLALPWAARGYAVIAPDHAGLGNEGVHAYLDNRDSGQVVLDGARALRRLLAAGALSSRVLLVGYSQGGGSVLSAQALHASYGSDGELAGVIGFAPEWQTRLNSFGHIDLLRKPTALTITTGVSKCTILALREHAFYGLTRGVDHAGDGFPEAERANLVAAIDSQCMLPLGGSIQFNQPRVGELTDESLRTSLLACVDGGPCVEPGKSFYAFLAANVLAADPAGPPLLYVQGLGDQILPPAEEAACNLDKLHADGVTPELCIDAQATHANIVERNLAHALAWSDAVLSGSTRPTCAATPLPPCRP